MHLGRFHKVVHHLAWHFKEAELPEKLNEAAALLDQYSSTKNPGTLQSFREKVEDLIKASEISDPNLQQPYSQQVLSELKVSGALAPRLGERVKSEIGNYSFDPASLATRLREVATKLSVLVGHVQAIDSSFTVLEVEYEDVADAEAEIGFLLPREAVGETLRALTSEFGQLAKLTRAVSELVGGADYDPPVVTISSSWWQVFLSLDAEQVLVWVLAIERIVGLFKSNLEIKKVSGASRPS